MQLFGIFVFTTSTPWSLLSVSGYTNAAIMTEGEIRELVQEFNNSNDRLILLDYDGTLVEFDPVPSKALLPEEVFNTLVALNRKPGTKVCIITGRSLDSINRMLGTLNVDVIVEHGAMIREKGVCRKEVSDNKTWIPTVIKVMNKMVIECPGSFIEEKEFSVAWHYRQADMNTGYNCSRDLIDDLQKIIQGNNLKILDGNRVIEVLDRETGKGIAVSKILDNHFYDFVLSIGDDVTDEEMFEYSLHHTNAFTVKVGFGASSATQRLEGVKEVVALIKLLSA